MIDHEHTTLRDQKLEQRLTAIAVSRGIGIGRVAFLRGDKHKFFRIDLHPSKVEAEIGRLRSAVTTSVKQLEALTGGDLPGRSISGIFDVHLLILSETAFIHEIEDIVRTQQVNVEWALKVFIDLVVERQAAVRDERFREKSLDIEDVVVRILSCLHEPDSAPQLTYAGAVIVARELRPSTILEVVKEGPAALVTERGGWTSHASILAREFQLPMVSGIKNLEYLFTRGESVIVDGAAGELIVNPSVDTLRHFQTLGSKAATVETMMEGALLTRDGTEITIRANVDAAAAYSAAARSGARGIGLYRSESLINRSGVIPGEDDQLHAYRELCDAAGVDGVKVRTFDIGIDQVDGNQAPELNPSLGLRSIRLSLTYPMHFRTQVRAILRASAGNNIDIVLPMITGAEDILRARAVISEQRADLEKEGKSIGNPMLGAMIEVPSSIFTARSIASKVDFLCLGTNDLVQHLLAVDRDNHLVADWYQTLHPAVIRAIESVLADATVSDVPTIVCGEMAGSAFYVPILIGLGAREMSMNPTSIPQIRDLVSGITIDESIQLVSDIRGLETAEEIEDHLRNYYLENWSALFAPGILTTKHR